MFKWVCLGVGVVFLSGIAWMVNDIRVQVRRSLQTVDKAGKTVNENLPTIVERTRRTTDTVSEHLPQIVDKARKTSDVLAELSEDIRQLKELAGATSSVRDKNLVAYADSVLTLLEKTNGVIGLKKTVGQGLKSPQPTREWVSGARKEALFLTAVVRSKKEMVTRLSKNKFGFHWYIQVGDQEPVSLYDWLKAHHPETMDL